MILRQVGEAVEKSGPVHRLGAKLCEIQTGLRSVQKSLEQRSPTVTEAKFTQKVGVVSSYGGRSETLRAQL